MKVTLGAAALVTAALAFAGCSSTPTAPASTPAAPASTPAAPASAPAASTPAAAPASTPAAAPSSNAANPSLKKIADVNFPAKVGTYTRQGEQTVKDGTKGAMYQSSAKAVVIVTAQTGSYSQIASVLKNPVKFAGGTCGTMEASGQAASACVGELSDGLMMVINSQQSDLAEQAKFAAALYAAS